MKANEDHEVPPLHVANHISRCHGSPLQGHQTGKASLDAHSDNIGTLVDTTGHEKNAIIRLNDTEAGTLSRHRYGYCIVHFKKVVISNIVVSTVR